ncbi:class I SAM-dependent methyltransferase [Shimia sp. SDUM112013]|uniref:class I SAM-dependent methyltransferase n=1 Tax=Shimia sp. SDUM112013 TaxID=3136160 RepID=UPI0032EF006F
MSKDANFWNRIAEKYAASPIRDTAGYEATLDLTRAHLKPSDRVLELGCGTGTTALKLAPNVAHITASDFAGAMIDICKTRAAEQGIENIDFLTADPFDRGFDGQDYDVVMGWNFYHLMEDMPAGFRRSHDLLKPGGLLVAKTPSLGSTPFFKRLFLRMVVRVLQLLGKAPSVAFVTIDEVETAVTSAGFEILETRNSGGMVPRSYLVARKA